MTKETRLAAVYRNENLLSKQPVLIAGTKDFVLTGLRQVQEDTV